MVLDPLGQVDGNGEANASVQPFNHGVDPDDFAIQIDQRAAAVARKYFGIGLDKILVGIMLEDAPLGANVAHRDRVVEFKGGADGKHEFAHPRGVGIAESGGRQSAGLDLHQRNVGLGIQALDLALESAAILQTDDDLVRIFNDVVIGQDVTVGRNDDAGAFTREPLLTRVAVVALAIAVFLKMTPQFRRQNVPE